MAQHKKVFGVSDPLGHNFGGFDILQGGNDLEGDYYGFVVVTAPATLKITPAVRFKDKYTINGSGITSSDDLVSYIPTGLYIPCHISKMTITGSGVVLLFKNDE